MESQGDRKSVRVTIYNQPYNLGVSGEPGEVEALAHSVDMLMTSIAQRAGNVDGMKVAVLACLQLSDKVRGLEQELAEYKTQVASKSGEFSVLLDGVLKQAEALK